MSTLTLNSPVDTDRTERMRDIWQRLLNQDGLADDAEFFDLGGNSVLLIGMLELIREEFGKELALEDLADGISIQRMVDLLG